MDSCSKSVVAMYLSGYTALLKTARLPSLIIILISAALIIYSQKLFKKSPAPVKQVPQVIKPSPTPTSEPEIKAVIGSVISSNKASVVLKTNSGEETYSLVETTVYKKIIPGKDEKGNSKTAPATFEDLKKGNHVLLSVNNKTGSVISIMVFN